MRRRTQPPPALGAPAPPAELGGGTPGAGLNAGEKSTFLGSLVESVSPLASICGSHVAQHRVRAIWRRRGGNRARQSG